MKNGIPGKELQWRLQEILGHRSVVCLDDAGA